MSRLLRWRPLLAIAIAAIGAFITTLLVRASWLDVLGEHDRLFRANADAVREQLLERVKATDEIMIGLATFTNSAAHLDADQFRLFTEGLPERHSYVLAAAYLPLVHHDERATFERSRREAGFPWFSVSERRGEEFR